MGSLPFHPWWHHPNANYTGKHRGRYEFWGRAYPHTAVPYGIRSILIEPYIDASGRMP